MPYHARFAVSVIVGFAAALYGTPLLALHAGFNDAGGNTVFSQEFLRDYQSADDAVNATRSVEPFLKLVSKYRQPNELAELELSIGVIYAQRTGFVDPAKAVTHLTNALGYTLPDETYLKAVLWRAGSYEQLGKLDLARRDHLRGLLACSDHNLPAEWPEIKQPKFPVSIKTGPENVDSEEVERLRDYQRYLKEVRLQQSLLMHRFYFIDGAKRISLKSRADSDRHGKELEELSPDPSKRASILQLLNSDNKRPWP